MSLGADPKRSTAASGLERADPGTAACFRYLSLSQPGLTLRRPSLEVCLPIMLRNISVVQHTASSFCCKAVACPRWMDKWDQAHAYPAPAFQGVSSRNSANHGGPDHEPLLARTMSACCHQSIKSRWCRSEVPRLRRVHSSELGRVMAQCVCRCKQSSLMGMAALHGKPSSHPTHTEMAPNTSARLCPVLL